MIEQSSHPKNDSAGGGSESTADQEAHISAQIVAAIAAMAAFGAFATALIRRQLKKQHHKVDGPDERA